MPQISIVTGLSAGGGAYSPALTDWVMMTEDSSMFLTGPGVVREALGEEVDAAQLGGTRVHERNGVCHFVAQDDFDASRLARDLLGYLPSHRGDPLPLADRRPAGGGDLATIVPERVAPRLRRPRRDRRHRRRRRTAGDLGRLGAQPRHRHGPDRRPPGRA